MKKISIFMVVVMLFAIFLPISAMAEGTTLRVKYPSELPVAGEEFEVTAEISGNPGVGAIQFALSYDTEKMECTKVREGELLEGAMTATNPSASSGVIVTAASISAMEGDGIIAIFNFTAKEDITEFDFQLVDIDLCDVNENGIEYEVLGATEREEVSSTPAPTAKPTSSPSSPSGGTTVVKPSEPETGNGDEEEITEPGKPIEGEVDGKVELFESYFPDAVGHWGENYILSAADKGLFKGDENGNFNPDANITRAQFVTVLWRMAGSPAVDKEAPFTDIANQIEEFKSAIAWGYTNGYINGTSDTTFDPDGTLTREAGMKILHYYSGGESGNEFLVSAIYDGTFEDSKEISDWAKPSVYWAFYNKLISGTSDTTLSPKDTATRAQLAKILVNYIDTYIN